MPDSRDRRFARLGGENSRRCAIQIAFTLIESVMTTTRLVRRASPAEQFVEHVGIGRIDRDNYVGLEPRQKSTKMIFQGEEDAKIPGEFFLPIEPPINYPPDSRRAINHPHVEDPRPIVSEAVGLSEEIVQLHVDATPDLEASIVPCQPSPRRTRRSDQVFFKPLGRQARATS